MTVDPDYIEAASVVHLRDFFDSIAAQMAGSYLLSFPASMDGKRHRLRVTIGSLSDERSADYPDLSGPIWPWLLGLAVLAGAGGVVFLLSRGRTVGKLSIVSGPKSGTAIALARGKTRIGSLEDNEVVLASSTVSRFHAEILVRGRDVQIVDLRSKNGTRVNGRVVERAPLQTGDKITIAEFELIYER